MVDVKYLIICIIVLILLFFFIFISSIGIMNEEIESNLYRDSNLEKYIHSDELAVCRYLGKTFEFNSNNTIKHNHIYSGWLIQEDAKIIISFGDSSVTYINKDKFFREWRILNN